LCQIYAIGACKDFYLGHWNKGEIEEKVGKGSVNKSNDFGERIVLRKLLSKEKFQDGYVSLIFWKGGSPLQRMNVISAIHFAIFPTL
jgi:hypothetical protein